MIRLNVFKLACLLTLPSLTASSASALSNGDFSEWSGGNPASWQRLNGVFASQVTGWSGPAARLQLEPGAPLTAALRQFFPTPFSNTFEVSFEFAYAAPGSERGPNLTLRRAGQPVLSFRIGAQGSLDLYDGSSWRQISPGNTTRPTDLSAPDPNRVYRITLSGSLATQSYGIALHSVASGILLFEETGLSFWQSLPGGQALDELRFERGRAGADYLIDNVQTRTPAPSEIAPPVVEEITAGEHPFLLFSAGDLPALRALAQEEPWTSIAADALDRAENWTFSTSGGFRERALLLKQIFSALSLAGILDEENVATHAQRFYEQFSTGYTHLAAVRSAGSWQSNTMFGSTTFEAILALDVFYHHLDKAQRSLIEQQIGQIVPVLRSWDPAPPGVRALWALYQNDLDAYRTHRTTFLNSFFRRITRDGVHVAGTNYALARLNFFDREQKHLLIDIIQRHEPQHLSAKQLERLRNTYEWLYGYAVAPHGWNHTFGDSAPNRTLNGAPNYPTNSPTAAYRAGRFSTDARAFASQHLVPGEAPAGGLLYFVLLDKNFTTVPPALAPSRIFRDGGAWLQSDDPTHGGLSGAMWNVTLAEGHTHKETNALSLVGYGNHLLANSGYAGWGTGALGFDSAFVNDRAISNNVVLIDYPLEDARNAPTANDHARKTGNGITRNLLSGEVDYARGDSGNALPNGRHIRHFAFVHSLDGLPGYWPVLDEVEGHSGTRHAHAAWHPYAVSMDVLEPGIHYRSQTRRLAGISGPHLDEGPRLHIHLTNPPAKTQMLEGLIAHFNNLSFVGPFLYPTYSLGNNHRTRFGTVFFPEYEDFPTPAFSRLSGDGWHATRLEWPDGRFDLWIVTTRDTAVQVGPIELRGKAAWFRCSPEGTVLRHMVIEGDFLQAANPAGSFQWSADQAGTLYSGPRLWAVPAENAASWTFSADILPSAYAPNENQFPVQPMGSTSEGRSR